jgi:hypothetical protein
MLQLLAMDKHSSLMVKKKGFIRLTLAVNVIKLFLSTSLTKRPSKLKY